MKRPPWNARRRRIDIALSFCAGVIIWELSKGADGSAAAINASFMLAGALLSVYTGAAVVDDRNVMQHMGADAYRDEAADTQGYESPAWPPAPGPGKDGLQS